MTQITLRSELEKAIEERAKAKGTTMEVLALDSSEFVPGGARMSENTGKKFAEGMVRKRAPGKLRWIGKKAIYGYSDTDEDSRCSSGSRSEAVGLPQKSPGGRADICGDQDAGSGGLEGAGRRNGFTSRA